MQSQTRVLIFVAVFVGIGSFVLGILIGHFGIPDGSCSTSPSSSQATTTPTENETISELMIAECSAKNIEDNVRQLSSRPHLAGTPAEKENAEMLVNLWTEYGFDSVRLLSYDVLLAYPDPENPNKVMITDNGVPVFTSALTEAVLRPEDNNTDAVPPFNAYSAQGEPEGPLVYANYGTADDFDWLAKNRPDIDINGAIVIVKYGNNFRGQKVYNAQKAGAAGVIIYSDPVNHAHDGTEAVYPNDWWLPDSGVQRGSVFVGSSSGDPVTPGYPSKPFMYRLNESDPSLPTIPVHPISYGDAQQLLSELAGDEVPDAWKGGLNITYRFGPGFTNPNRQNFQKETINPFSFTPVSDYMDSALDNFTEAAHHFEMRLADIDLKDSFAVRRVNDQMMQLERAFIDPAGLPDRKWLRHLIFAPSSIDSYAGSEFPAVVDALYRIDDDPDQQARWDNVRKQLAILTFTIQSAASTLSDVTQL
nr:glutamate carboxypeptidase 2-like [Lytechinus pictus]